MRALLVVLAGGLALARGKAVGGKDGLQVEVTLEARCKETQQAEKGDKVTVHYGGFLQDGKKFDSSFDRAQPFTFTMGVGQVIPGWDQGLLGVCPGEERHLVVPASLAYGDRGAGDVIPPGAILLFDIVIVDVEKEGAEEEENKRRNEEEDRRIAEEKAQKALDEEEERRRAEKEARVEQEVRRQQEVKAREEDEARRQEEVRRREEEEEVRRVAAAAREEQEQRRRQEVRRREEEKAQREAAAEKARLAEEELQREEEAARGQEEQEGQRRQEYDDEDEYYYYDYEPESSCEPGQLKVQVTDTPARCSRKSRNDDQLTMHYTGKLSSGKKFDSSVDRNKPFQFTLGVGQVIAGWDEGLLGMCVGERRTLIIPPDLAYGEEGVGSVIPACSVLVFEVELLDIANN